MPDDRLARIAEVDCLRKTPESLLEWAVERLHPRLALASSFVAEDVVLIHMLRRIEPRARVFTLDTGRLHAETYDLMERIRHRFGLTLEVLFPETGRVEEMVRAGGPNLFYAGVGERKLCCRVRKHDPLERMLATLDGWITGRRAARKPPGTETRRIEIDRAHGGILRLNPLADWTSGQVWRYVRDHDLPYHALHDRGFGHIGCAPCTRAIRAGEQAHAGRWWWERPWDSAVDPDGDPRRPCRPQRRGPGAGTRPARGPAARPQRRGRPGGLWPE